jgi:hypothetical protein
MRRFLLLLLCAVTVAQGAQKKISELDAATTVSTNVFAAVIVGDNATSTNYETMKMAAGLLLYGFMTNNTTLYFYMDGGVIKGYATNIASAQITSLDAAKLTGTIDTNRYSSQVLLLDQLNSQAEFELRLGWTLPGAGSGDDVFVNGSDITNPDFDDDTYVKHVVSGTNVVTYVTNLVNAHIASGAAIDATKIGAGGVTTTEFGYVGGLTSDAQAQLDARALAALTITIAGTANEITSSAGAQSLAANRTWTLSLPSALTFTGKTITGGTYSSPTITTPTIASFANATHNHQNAAGGGTLAEAALVFTDITTGNATASAHGFLPKLSGNANQFLDGSGAFSTPAGSGANWTAEVSTNSLLAGIAKVWKMQITNSLEIFGTTAGTIYLGDDDNSAGVRFSAQGTMGGNLNVIWPDNAPTVSGYSFGILSAVTNVVIGFTNTLAHFEGLVSADIAIAADVNGVINDTALAASWNGIITNAASKNAVHDYVIQADSDLDGEPDIVDSTGFDFQGTTDTTVTRASAGRVAVEGVNLVGTSTTDTLTNKEFDAGATGNTLKFTDYKDFVYPSRVDGTGCIIGTTNTANVWGLASYNGTADTNANYAIYRIGTVPIDLDTSVAMTLKGLWIRVDGSDTDAAQFTIALYNPTSSSAGLPTDFTGFSTFINFDSGTLTTPALGDGFSVADVTLTGWAAALTAGEPFIIAIARRNGSNDDIVSISNGTIEYGRTK